MPQSFTACRSAWMIRRSAALAGISGAIIAGPRAALAQNGPSTVRMGAMAIDACGTAFYGRETGLFQTNGIDPQITVVDNGVAAVAAVLGGDLDVGIGNVPQIAVAITRGLPLQMIAPASLYLRKDASPNLVVAKDSPIKSAKDLVAATIGVSALGDFNQLSVLGWFDANRVSHEKVKFVEIKFGEVGQALQRGVVQAAIITEPQKSAAMRAGLIRDLADTFIAIAPVIATLVWFSTKEWLLNNAILARRLAKAIYTVGAWANDHQADSGAILVKVTKIDPTMMATMIRRVYPTTNDPRYVEPLLALAARYGMLPRPVTFKEFSAF